jgi:ubiquitin C-terminal hydrolase
MEHLTSEKCVLALSFDAQAIYCLLCDKLLPIEPGTFCAQLLGIEKPDPTVTATRAPTKSSPHNRTPLRGLVNLGNSCWMNSTLQVLFRMPVFYSDRDGPLSASFAQLFSEVNDQGHAIRPHHFATELIRQRDFFSVREQHDAYEFLALFLDAIRDEQKGRSIGLRSTDRSDVEACLTTVIDGVFGFATTTTTECGLCHMSDRTFERTAVISLFVPYGGSTTIEECLQVYFSPSSIDADGRICEHCESIADCVTCSEFIPELMPRILVLHVSRFRVGKNGYVKNNVKVAFREILCLNDIFPFDINYRLMGLVSHYGTMDGGHYVSVARVKEEFFLFNDDVVTPLTVDRATMLQAYLLFYEKMV